MAASNFHNRNASRIFAFEIEDEFDWQILKDNVISEKKALGNLYVDGGEDEHELRNYPSSVLGRLFLSKSYKDFNVDVFITAIVRSAYYEGGNLDWQLDYFVNDESYNEQIDKDSVISQLEGDYSYPPSKVTKYAKSIVKWQEWAGNHLQAMLEKIYSDFTQPLVKVATFSNGETIYKKLK